MRTTSFMAVPHRGHDMLCFVPERSDTGRPSQSSSRLVICQRLATDLVRAAVEKALIKSLAAFSLAIALLARIPLGLRTWLHRLRSPVARLSLTCPATQCDRNRLLRGS